MKIIDAHAHIYPLKIGAKAVNAIGNFYNISMSATSGSSEELVSHGKEIGVERYIVHSTATTPTQVTHINDFIHDATLAHPEFIGFGTLHPAMTEEEIVNEVERMVSFGLKGIKLHPDFQTFYIDAPEAAKIYEAASGKLPILFHAGDNRYDYSSPQRIAKIARQYRDLTVIAAHFGGYRRWDDVDVYKRLSNIHFDTSSSLPFISTDKARSIISMLGEENFIFGTDFPMWSHTEELKRFNALNLPDNVAEDILYNNAAKLLGLNKI